MSKPKYIVEIFEMTSLDGPVWHARLTCNCGVTPEHRYIEARAEITGGLDALLYGIRQALLKHEEKDIDTGH
jgi:hypothetical protein